MFGFQPLGVRNGEFFCCEPLSTSLWDEAVAPRFFKSGREGSIIFRSTKFISLFSVTRNSFRKFISLFLWRDEFRPYSGAIFQKR